MTTIRRLHMAAAILAIGLLTACGGQASSPPVNPGPPVAAPSVDPQTAAKFSAADIDAAWRFSVALEAKYKFNPALMVKKPNDVGPRDFTGIRAAMTPSAVKGWDALLAAMPDPDAHSQIQVLAQLGFNSNVSKLNPKKPVTGVKLDSHGQVTTSPDGRLTTIQHQQATVHLVAFNKSKIKYLVKSDVTLNLVKDGGQWKIDGWDSTGTNSNYKNEK